MMNQTARKPQSGNMFIYILGAIFLIGLLVVIMRGGFQPGTGIDAEKAILQATKIRKYGAELEAGVSRILANGVSEASIRFAHANADAGYGTPGDQPERQVFEPEGGGVEWQSPPTGLQTTASPWYFSAVAAADGVGTTCAQAQCVELLAHLMYLPKEVCIALNNSIGVTNPSGEPPEDTDGYGVTTLFTGTFAHNSSIVTTDDHTKAFMEGCVNYAGTYSYYRVLLAR